MSSYLERLDQLSEHFGEEAYEEHTAFLELLKSMVSVVREAEIAGASDFPQIVEGAAAIFDRAVFWAYMGLPSRFEFLPSFAHSPEESPVKDTLVVKTPGDSRSFVVHMDAHSRNLSTAGREMSMEALASWDELMRLEPELSSKNRAYHEYNATYASSRSSQPHSTHLSMPSDQSHGWKPSIPTPAPLAYRYSARI